MHPNAKPVLHADPGPAGVVLSVAQGMAEDVTIYCRRAHEREFSLLADEEDDLPYHDTRPKLGADPEKRFYYAVLLYSGEENRLRSDEVEVTVH